MRKANNQNNQKSNAGKKLIDQAQLKQMFNKFTHGKQYMTDQQLFQFIQKELGVSGEDILFGHIAVNVMKIKKIEQTFFENFEALFKHVNASSLKDVHDAVKTTLRNQIKNSQTYKSMYRGLFDLYSGKYTTLDFQVAQQLWQFYLKQKLTYYKQFFQYLNSLEQKPKIHKDPWNMMLEFANQVKDVKNINEGDGWPVFIDNFVEFINKKK